MNINQNWTLLNLTKDFYLIRSNYVKLKLNSTLIVTGIAVDEFCPNNPI